MADYVLDTHALVFMLAAPKKLGGAARKALRRVEAGHEVAWIPTAVAVEVVLLNELGRIEIGLPELKNTLERVPSLRLLAMDLTQVDEFTALASIREAFDRLIVAAARSLRAKLVTRNQRIRDSRLVQTVWD